MGEEMSKRLAVCNWLGMFGLLVGYWQLTVGHVLPGVLLSLVGQLLVLVWALGSRVWPIAIAELAFIAASVKALVTV